MQYKQKHNWSYKYKTRNLSNNRLHNSAENCAIWILKSIKLQMWQPKRSLHKLAFKSCLWHMICCYIAQNILRLINYEIIYKFYYALYRYLLIFYFVRIFEIIFIFLLFITNFLKLVTMTWYFRLNQFIDVYDKYKNKYGAFIAKHNDCLELIENT